MGVFMGLFLHDACDGGGGFCTIIVLGYYFVVVSGGLGVVVCFKWIVGLWIIILQ